MSQVQLQLEKLKDIEEKAKTTIQAIQQEIDESAKVMAAQNAEHQKQKEELEIRKKLALKSVEEKYQRENTELEAKNWEKNEKFAKEMASFKEQLKDKVNWKQVDLVMGKNLVSPIANAKGNGWNKTKNSISISVDGLNATNTNNTTGCGWRSVSAEKGFTISVDFSGPVMYYFEVTITSMSSLYRRIIVGLSSGNVPNGYLIGGLSNSYAIIDGCDYCWLSGYKHDFEWPNGATKHKQRWDGPGDVIGCGLLLTPGNGVAIFFAGNGLLMGTQIPINTSMDTLYPTVSMDGSASVEANFGDDSAKPFKYDIKKCPGIVFK